ncbi:L-serine ammonia-lyase, iron-sulfur-dependent, subunit alpha [Tepidanaerobacter sp. EBM-49]|uniref:L-cysteine desulfidase family protein n=1 Tax=Tepidanaerobacter sp. EBM-49 TaxID=1918504 RepID=UPI000AED4601|nr:L-serine ammonia-lyase, iron-sulfur-dependent, subunit alpha [Tepidanaerobacter sp. EBM-49]
MEKNELLSNILKFEVTPALGCTEPVAVAYAVAKAKETVSGKIEKLDIIVDRNVFKNSMAVKIPGSDKKGLKFAGALGIVGGNSNYKLEVLKDISKNDIVKAQQLVEQDIIHVSLKNDAKNLYIEVVAWTSNENARVVIENKHDEITLIEKNGKEVYQKNPSLEDRDSYMELIKSFMIADFKKYADEIELDKIQIVEQGIKMNKRMAEAGLKNICKTASIDVPDEKVDFTKYAKMLTSAACYARMSGYLLPVMSCAGSGNHGLTAILPVVAAGEVKGINSETVARGVTLSLLITIFVKSFTGILSPVCGCGVAAGVGASAGITYILGGTLSQIEGAINNMIGGIPGIICDGGKPGCAFKLSISSNAAVEAAIMALNDFFISSEEGIVAKTAEDSIKNLGKVSTEGMHDTDEVILEVMMTKSV